MSTNGSRRPASIRPKHIRSTGAATVATGNPGCLLHLMNGARRQGLDLRFAHPVTLLAEAYRRETDRDAGRL